MNDGKPKCLVSLADLARDDILELIERAEYHAAERDTPEVLEGRTLANLFYEVSTRTRVSFELAARRLGAVVINLDIARSSTTKGESLTDTARTLHAMGIGLFVVRHAELEAVRGLVENLRGDPAGFVCAGAGTDTHPTQGLIDALTLKQHFGDCEGLTVAIVGDVAHSRVARSAIEAFGALGVGEIRIAGPDGLVPGALPGTRKCTGFDEALDGADAVMMLRVQHERLAGAAPDAESYAREWKLDAARLARAAGGAIVLHPGPVNRGVEIDDRVADGDRSRILQQVRNGVPVRKAVLEWMVQP